ncbi:hypothetical protein Tco_0084972 [Tanacetum coccineum]
MEPLELPLQQKKVSSPSMFLIKDGALKDSRFNGRHRSVHALPHLSLLLLFTVNTSPFEEVGDHTNLHNLHKDWDLPFSAHLADPEVANLFHSDAPVMTTATTAHWMEHEQLVLPSLMCPVSLQFELSSELVAETSDADLPMFYHFLEDFHPAYLLNAIAGRSGLFYSWLTPSDWSNVSTLTDIWDDTGGGRGLRLTDLLPDWPWASLSFTIPIPVPSSYGGLMRT